MDWIWIAEVVLVHRRRLPALVQQASHAFFETGRGGGLIDGWMVFWAGWSEGGTQSFS